MEKAVRRHDGRGSGEFATLTISMPVEIFEMWNDAYELAERMCGAELEKWQVLEPSLAEFLGTHLPVGGGAEPRSSDEAELPGKARDAVLDRDGWQCKFSGCTMRKTLDVHHIEFRSHQGSDEPGNLITLCRSCRPRNMYMAELDYGQETMDRYRRSPDRVREPAPSFELRPNRARDDSSSGSPGGAWIADRSSEQLGGSFDGSVTATTG